jgi:hypothetical protein
MPSVLRQIGEWATGFVHSAWSKMVCVKAFWLYQLAAPVYQIHAITAQRAGIPGKQY